MKKIVAVSMLLSLLVSPFAFATYPDVAGDYNWSASEKAANCSLLSAGNVIDDDDDDFLTSVGLRYSNDENISAGFEWNHRFDRDDFEEDTLNLDLRIQF